MVPTRRDLLHLFQSEEFSLYTGDQLYQKVGGMVNLHSREISPTLPFSTRSLGLNRRKGGLTLGFLFLE